MKKYIFAAAIGVAILFGYFKVIHPTVLLGDEFILVKGGVAQVKGADVSLRIKDFINSGCSGECVSSVSPVVLELTVNGKVYGGSGSHQGGAPYTVLIKKTDYRTYATFVINKRIVGVNDCTDKTPGGKEACIEDLAVQLGDKSLCKNVVSPKGYCRYLELVSQDALELCDSVSVYAWKDRCFIEIANKRWSAENPNIDIELNGPCARLDADNKVRCIKEYFKLGR